MSSITQAAQFPVKQGTLVHVQLAYQEAINALALALIGSNYNPNQAYILYGCVNSGSGSAVNISQGAVFYNGEVFLVNQVSFFLGGGQVPVANIQTTFYTINADPVLFTDNVQRNVHQIRTIAIVAGSSGSGQVGDFSSFSGTGTTLSITGSAVSGSYPDYVINLPSNRIVATGTIPIGNVGFSGNVLSGNVISSYNVSFSDLGTTSYIATGTLVSLSATTTLQEQDSATDFVIVNKSTTGFTVIVKKKDSSSGNTNLNFDYMVVTE